jgi:hypothetical protein
MSVIDSSSKLSNFELIVSISFSVTFDNTEKSVSSLTLFKEDLIKPIATK